MCCWSSPQPPIKSFAGFARLNACDMGVDVVKRHTRDSHTPVRQCQVAHAAGPINARLFCAEWLLLFIFLLGSAARSQTDPVAMWMFHSQTGRLIHSPASFLRSLPVLGLSAGDSWVEIYLQDINGHLWLLCKPPTRCSGINPTWSTFWFKTTNWLTCLLVVKLLMVGHSLQRLWNITAIYWSSIYIV